MLNWNGLDEAATRCRQQRIACLCAPSRQDVLFSTAETDGASPRHPLDECGCLVLEASEMAVAGLAEDPLSVAPESDGLLAARLGVACKNEPEIFFAQAKTSADPRRNGVFMAVGPLPAEDASGIGTRVRHPANPTPDVDTAQRSRQDARPLRPAARVWRRNRSRAHYDYGKRGRAVTRQPCAPRMARATGDGTRVRSESVDLQVVDRRTREKTFRQTSPQQSAPRLCWR